MKDVVISIPINDGQEEMVLITDVPDSDLEDGTFNEHMLREHGSFTLVEVREADDAEGDNI